MAANTSTLKFLPAIFQTDTNEKFLNATLDQLTSEADLRRINGYIGRKFAPTYKTSDNYIAEPTTARQNYQLEPTVVVQNKQENTISLFSTYIDLIQQISTLGGNVSDHSRLFANESYTFDGLFDFDKFGNYNNYFWLPNGPDAVDVYASTVDKDEVFTVTRNLAVDGYNFSGKGTGANPVLTLARGGTYKFNLSQQGNRFWIQTEPGVSGTKLAQSNVSTRNIFGVSGNGASVGQIVFNVPRKTAQDSFAQMELAAFVDVATSYGYKQIQHQMLSILLQTHPDVFDGITTELHKKTLIFVNTEIDDAQWETPGVFDKNDEPYDYATYDPGEVVPAGVRRGVWTIELQAAGDGDYLVVLIPKTTVEINQRVYVSIGINNANQQYWLERTGFYSVIPENTAALDRLYYQDGSNPDLYGIIQIVDAEGYSIDVANTIIGQKSYTSPNGVVFTNGLKIQFDSSVTDPQYINNQYYVEGVGTAIQLVKVDDLVTPEAYAANGIDTPDYITINRDSIDHNAWSRSNRWFHIDVIQATAKYNNTVAAPNQAYRAQRPIIEFEGHLQLFNAGRVAKQPVDLLINDGTITDAMNQLEGTLVTATPSSVLLEIENTDPSFGIIDIYAEGIGYQIDDLLTVSGTVSTVPWVPGGTATQGIYYLYNNNYYLATSSGTFSTELPVHTNGTVTNGTVSLLYTGTKAILKVTEVTETGGVVKLSVVNGGAFAIPVVDAVSLTGGQGTGVRVNLTYKLQSINFDSHGSGFFYETEPTVTIQSTFPWASEGTAEQFKYYSYLDTSNTAKPITYYYQATSNGIFDSSPPSHTSGTTLNGTVSLKFLGVIEIPTWEPPDTWSTWSSGGTATLDNYYVYGNKYYQATSSGTFGSSAPTHTSGSITNGTVPLVYKGRILNLDTNGNALASPSINTVTLNKSRVYSISFNSKGAGYTAIPKVVLSSPTVMTPIRAVFADDFDPSIKNSVYTISAIDTTAGSTSDVKVHLTLTDDYEVLEGNCINVTKGDNAGFNFYYNGTSWKQGQLKKSINQNPLFDIVDSTGVSLSNTTYYPVSSFKGTAIFSYKVGTAYNDKVLGFPLSYRNFNSIGDIQFTNNFDTEIITYASGSSTVSVPVNYNFLKQNKDLTTYSNRNIWTKNIENTKQYQIFSFAYTSSNYFPVDVLPVAESAIPYTKVFVNNQLLKSSDYAYVLVGSRQTVKIDYTLLKENDKVDILIYSKSVSRTGYYEIPNSLDYNSKNANFASLTLGQIRSHITKIKENTKLAVDIGSSFSGLRDIQYKGNGGNIVQQSAPAMYSNIFLTDKNLNFAQSVDYAAREYTRFKNKFLELATKLDNVTIDNIADSVDAILKNINSIKNKTFPWYYSDMVPYGDNANVINYIIINPLAKQYEITQVFVDTKLSNLAVLVYLNGIQLVNGKDFVFLQDRSAILLDDTITLAAGDKLKIVEYNNTDGSFIPETPSKLGLYPKFVPQKFVDSSYITPVEVIQGHDGSITPVFNDIRDDLLLELEKRIYNNIKINYETHIFDLFDHLPGKFRNTDYSLTEFNQILSNKFLRWVGDNRVDYSTNNYFVSGNAWTWNYKKFKDRIDGKQLPGTWRAIFSYFFDTYRPNTHPWEMLGFGQKPTWWENRYGPAPYTGGNKLLWDDLELGYIHEGYKAGIDPRFARPGLSQIIPVDEYGDLLSPEKWAAANFDSLKANSSYSVGDQGPVEFAWRTSSYFPYALQYALALSKPGYYFGSLINVDRYYRNTTIDQLVNTDSHQRITPTTVVVNGDTTNGSIVRSAGYLNWIRDYVLSIGMDPVTSLRTYLDTVNVQLGYKVGGYTDKKFIEVLAEQGSPTNTSNSIIIPTENYNIHLNHSTPIRKAVYSAVVVERTENGFTVNGYNQNSPFFTIIPSLANNNFYIVEVLKRRGIIYKDYQNIKLTVPYGFEFGTEQEVVDFLISYGRYLTAQGFKFETQDNNLGETRNWVLSAKEFLNWAQQGWKTGNIVVLSPVYNELVNVQPDGVISIIDNTPNGTKVLDQNFDFIKNTQFTESRIGNKFTLKSLTNQTICLADLTVVQYEHAILFDNVTVFNDIVYVPELGNRQFRLKLIGSKTGSWTGTFSPPGFVYNNTFVDHWQPGVDYLLGSIVQYKNLYYTALTDVVASAEFVQDKQWRQINQTDVKTGLLPNLTYSATRLKQVYDVDNLPNDMTLKGYGTSLIGFRKRGYLSNFGLDETSQVKFFQGFIKEKGTLNAITGLTNAKVNEWSSGIDIYEQWALRVGEYGSLTTDQIVEVELDETVVTANPTAIQFLNSGEIEPLSDVISFQPADLYKAPPDFNKNLFFNRNDATETINDIQTAGYPSLLDVDETLFSFTNYNELDRVLSRVGPGYYIWVAKDYTNEWNVYRVTETQINVENMSYNIDNLMTITFTDAPNLARGDVFAVKSFDSRLDGFYQVYAVTDENQVQVAITNNAIAISTGVDNSRTSTIKELKSINGYGVFYKLQSARLGSLLDANALLPLNGWEPNDKLWVDVSDAGGNWAVYNKVDAWQENTEVVVDEAASTNGLFGTTVTSNKIANNFFVGSPRYNNPDGSTGIVKTFSRIGKTIRQTSKFDPRSNLVGNFGQTITASDYTVAIGAPFSNNNKGYVYIQNLATSTLQVLTSNTAAVGDFFGNAVSISLDNDWMYIGAPGANSVYVYNYQDSVELKSNTITYINTLTKANVTTGSANIIVSIPTTLDTNLLLPGTPIGDDTYHYFNAGTTIVSVANDVITVSNPANDTGIDINTIKVYPTNYQLGYTPVNKYALSISDQYQNYVVDVDFTLSGNTVTFVHTPTIDGTKISVVQTNYYQNIGTVPTPADVVAGDQFGESMTMSDDAKTLFVGAPGQSSNSGAVYVFQRFEESHKSNLDNIYDSSKTFNSYTKVYVDALFQDPTTYSVTNGTRLSFNTPLQLGSVILIVSDDWVLVQKITEPTTGPGNKFGTLITADHITGSTFYVSAPNTPQDTGESGAVYRYTNTAKILGSITATSTPDYVKSSIINGGTVFDSNIGLYINGYYVNLSSSIQSGNVYYSGTTPTTANIDIPNGYAYPEVCADLINSAKIPTVTATTTADGFFTISSTNQLSQNKLSVRPNGSNFFDLAGLTSYSLDQVIKHPKGSLGFGFASQIKYSPETQTLCISSTQDNIYYVSEVDTGKTTYDQRSTRIIDVVKSSGSVFVYELLSDSNTGKTNTGLMSLVQHIKSTGLNENDQFGQGLDINKDLILIGAPGDDSIAFNAGAVHVFTNTEQIQSWNKIRNQEVKVDLDNINKFFIYDKTTDLVKATLDYIDPVKGKILGIAEQDLDFKTALDPAIYNAGNRSGVSISSNYHWNERQVGKVWWNLNNLRYIDYEQGNLIYRTNNWGKLFPGSQVQVCEWIKSKFPPAQYVTNGGDGSPLYTDAYCVVTTVIGGIITPEYYYWVVNKQSAAPGKHYSISLLADIIENPQLQGIPYGFMSKNNAVGLVNVQKYLNAKKSVLHIDYQKIHNENSVHTEYELINDGQPNIQLPARIIDKLIDSLSGIDSIGQVVPDPSLNDSEKIGLNTRPVQTLVIDRSKAVENFVKYVNGVLIKYPVVYQYSLLGIEKFDPLPASTEYDKIVTTVEDIGYIDTSATISNALPVGYRVLVTSDSSNSGLWTIYTLDSSREFSISRIQYYNTALYWDKVDWYAEDYDPTSRITYTVTSYKDIAALTLSAGNIVRVNYDDNGQFSIYRTNSDLSLERVGIEKGTIQLKSTLYNLASGQMGWDEDRFDTVRFDQTPGIEIRNILIALRDDIFINSLGAEFNKLFFVIVNYILQEQKSVDWIFKTSFISIFHKLRELSQPPSFVLDNQEYYLDYINEVKPYRTIVREYVVDYTGSDTVESNVTDFDLPSLYNKTLGRYRPPSGELPGDATLINTTPEYQYWKQYHTYTVDSIEISSPGRDYKIIFDPNQPGVVVSPAVTITGGGGTGATAVVSSYNIATGAITGITVTNSGSGYTSRPEVKINGTGTGGLAAARIINRTARQFDSVLKFDRTAYGSSVSLWSSANAYATGSVVAYNGQAYRASANIGASTNFNYDTFELLTGEEVGNANDRVIAYIASNQVDNLDTTTALGSEIDRAHDNRYWLTQYFSGIEYPGVRVQGLKFNANVSDQQLLDTVIQSRYVDTGLGTRPEDINIDGGAYIDYYSSHAPEELLPGVVHESVDISVFTKEVYTSGNTNVKPDGKTFSYREFFDINGKHNYYRISGFATAQLNVTLTSTSNVVIVNDGSLLPQPDLVLAIPGRIFIGGELITYWENDGQAPGRLTNIRRGVGGTSTQSHALGELVYDASAAQTIPTINARTAIISSNSSFSSNATINHWRANSSSSVFTTVENVTYKLTLNGNITANCGDYITQVYSGANAIVRGNVSSAKTVAVTFLTGNITLANTSSYIQINGATSTVAPLAISILGNVDVNGSVTVTAPTIAGLTTNVEIRQDSTAWYDWDKISSLGITRLQEQNTEASNFLGQGGTIIQTDLSIYYTIETATPTSSDVMTIEGFGSQAALIIE